MTTTLVLGSLRFVGEPATEPVARGLIYAKAIDGEDIPSGQLTLTPTEWQSLLAVSAVVEAAKEWKSSRCTRMPECDPYDGSHDAECLLSLTEGRLMDAVIAIDALSPTTKDTP